MTNRREMLQISMAATVLPLDAATAWAAPSAGGAHGDKPVALYTALYDTRFAASRAFGERMGVQGIAATAMTGDMTPFWFDNLHHRWQQSPVAVAGLTTRGPLFCLERLAWDYGMRVVFRAEHSASTDGSVRHELEGESVLMEAVRAAATQEDWVGVMSNVVGHYPRTSAASTRAQLHTARPAVQVPESESLFSWVIAPVARS